MATMTISLPTQIAQQVNRESSRRGYATRSEFFRALLRKYFGGELSFEVYKKKPLKEIKLELARTGKYSQAFIESIVSGLSKSSAYED